METLKKRIIDTAIERQRQVIGDFRERVKDLMATDGNVNEGEYDNHQQFKSQRMTEVDLLNEELEIANREFAELLKMRGFPEHKHKCVAYGSVVKTDRKTFFVSAGIEDFYVDEIPLFGVSVNEPVYKSMKGKKVGESFTCGEHKYKILEIW